MRETVFSPCRKYRYTLWREWDIDMMAGCADDCPNARRYLMVIGLNPSTADETKDDPTIRRCIAFAKSWGYGSLCMTNLFAWRETDSTLLKSVANPVGEDNQHHLLQNAAGAGMVIAAWGTKGSLLCQDLTVRQWLAGINVQLHCLRKTKEGHPEHPLYLPKSTKPILFV